LSQNQFQEKLEELTPLPDLLKATQLRLQEAQQLRMIAERNCEEIARELDELKDKVHALSLYLSSKHLDLSSC
jgi:outer dense fiber protein 2